MMKTITMKGLYGKAVTMRIFHVKIVTVGVLRG